MEEKRNLFKFFPLDENGSLLAERYMKADAEDDLDVLGELFTSSDFFQLPDSDGHNFLHRTVLLRNKMLFRHILSFRDFPIDAVNNYGITAFEFAMADVYERVEPHEIYKHEDFALELLKRGARPHAIALHDACRVNFIKVAKLLIEMGADPHEEDEAGHTPFLYAFRNQCRRGDLAAILLTFDVEPFLERECGYSEFDLGICSRGCRKRAMLEFLCDYCFDDNTHIKVNLSTLFRMAEQNLPIFHKVVEKVTEVRVDETSRTRHYPKLFTLNRKYLKILVEKCGFLMISMILSYDDDKFLVPFTINTDLSLDNFSGFIEETFGLTMTDFATCFNSNNLVAALCYMKLDESLVTKVLFYLTSYGLVINELDYLFIYDSYGYSGLFKLMLHMEYHLGCRGTRLYLRYKGKIRQRILPMFLYRIDLDLTTLRQGRKIIYDLVIEELFEYFCRPSMKQFLLDRFDCNLILWKLDQVPKVPLLQELARDVFRKFVIDRYQVKTTGQFISHINQLDMSLTYKKIICLEKPLYKFKPKEV